MGLTLLYDTASKAELVSIPLLTSYFDQYQKAISEDPSGNIFESEISLYSKSLLVAVLDIWRNTSLCSINLSTNEDNIANITVTLELDINQDILSKRSITSHSLQLFQSIFAAFGRLKKGVILNVAKQLSIDEAEEVVIDSGSGESDGSSDQAWGSRAISPLQQSLPSASAAHRWCSKFPPGDSTRQPPTLETLEKDYAHTPDNPMTFR